MTANNSDDRSSKINAQYFDKLRTNAFINHNPTANYIEFWAAMKTGGMMPDGTETWAVKHYTIYNPEQAAGFLDGKPIAKDVSFMEALFQLSANEFIRQGIHSHSPADLTAMYPKGNFPELDIALQKYFYDFEHYRDAAHIEGVIFDMGGNEPYLRQNGIVFAEGQFRLGEISDSVLAVERALDNNEKFRQSIEGGILSDIYNSVSVPEASYDTLVKVAKVLKASDPYAVQMGAFYLAIQKLTGINEKFDRVEGFNDSKERADCYALSQKMAAKYTSYDDILCGLIPEMEESVAAMKKLGVKTEPFEKNNSECALYIHLLVSAENKSKLEESFTRVHGVNTDTLTQMQESLERAVETFISLGGTEQRAGKLRAWVFKPTSSTQIEPSIPAFLTRYYQKRNDTMKKVLQRQAGLRDVQTMPYYVKPPLTEVDQKKVDAAKSTPKPPAGGPSNG
jgi:hypothetical protein